MRGAACVDDSLDATLPRANASWPEPFESCDMLGFVRPRKHGDVPTVQTLLGQNLRLRAFAIFFASLAFGVQALRPDWRLQLGQGRELQTFGILKPHLLQASRASLNLQSLTAPLLHQQKAMLSLRARSTMNELKRPEPLNQGEL